MINKKKPLFQPILIFSLILSFLLLACGVTLPSQEQVETGLATAQALGEQAAELATGAAPTLQAAVEDIQAAATNAGPTLEALQTRAIELATSAAPTVNAGLDQLATAAVRAQDTGENVQATLQAAGIDGNYLIEKISALRPDENGNIVIVITETELNLVLQARQALAVENQQEVVIPAAEVRFTDGLIIFSGEVTSPVEGTVNVSLQPQVTDGALSFVVTTADLNGRPVPPALLSTVETTINTALLTSLNTALLAIPGNYVIQTVSIGDGLMTIIAGRINDNQ